MWHMSRILNSRYLLARVYGPVAARTLYKCSTRRQKLITTSISCLQVPHQQQQQVRTRSAFLAQDAIKLFTSKYTKRILWGLSSSAIITTSYLFGKEYLLLTCIPLLLLNHRDIYIISKTFKRDVHFIQRYLRALAIVTQIPKKDMTLHRKFRKVVKHNPNAIMIEMFDVKWKFSEVLAYANKVSRLMQKYKHEKGDVVGVFVMNSPEYIALLLGITEIGVIAALLNTHVRKSSLLHCIRISKCRTLIIDENLMSAIEDIKSQLDPNILIFQMQSNKPTSYKILEKELTEEKDETPEMFIKLHHNDPLIYIYTSGTSGTPKAAVVPHSKFLVTSLGTVTLLGLNQNRDKIYDPLPLYHTTGLIVGIGPALVRGVPVVVRPRFSSKNYFQECKKHNCTIAQYIGEICRYLLLVPPSSSDRDHPVRRVLGNGINIATWNDFVTRFNVTITELYGATEGNCNMINIDGKHGAVGFIPVLLPKLMHPFAIIRTGDDSNPIRGVDGLCQECEPNELGMLVGFIRDRVDTKYHGYVSEDKTATTSKIVHDVFRKGDKAFMTGDVLLMDEMQYFYFKDRTGETFRWKGENVSTVEVETLSTTVSGVICACYGVPIPGYVGKAGMLVMSDPTKSVDLDKFAKEMYNYLPKYAVPRFVRLIDQIETTGTHKLIKSSYIKDGLDLEKLGKHAYYLDMIKLTYLPLTEESLKKIYAGEINI